MDYVIFPIDVKGKTKIEKMQYKGIRIALGYRNSTPTNVMIPEAKVMRMEERAGFLARNFWIKKFMYSSIVERIRSYEELVRRQRFINPRSNNCILVNAWTEVYRNRNEMTRYDSYEIFDINYWCLIDVIETDIEVGTLKKKRGNITDGELLEIFINKFNLENNVEIFYTDGSKQEDRNSVGIRIVKEDSDTGYQISINNKFILQKQ